MITALTHSVTLQGMFWLTITLIAYIVGLAIHRRCYGHPAAHPLIVTVLLVAAVLMLTHTSVQKYQVSAQLLHWLLGPVTVALALPIYRQWAQLKHYGWRLIVSICAGGVIAPLLAWYSLWVFSAPTALQLTILAKSITTPLAMEATRQIGGIPALAAVFVIVTGIVGSVLSGWVFRLFNVQSTDAQGIALGTVAHGIGTARAIHMGEDVAAMATLALCINGIATALVLPLLYSFFSFLG
ncbi:LrgB family protein [Alteromonas sp. 345S023]|uniref:LrgB family protein n=1 Tax=Alteromonas profundi TaxID=2696062 RepID=A0A7X5RJJ7_9ALTE|nr:LrgB family protein [Alteromonas profundi]NDV89714.1 LrgB family protein [Alteromonas profundi]